LNRRWLRTALYSFEGIANHWGELAGPSPLSRGFPDGSIGREDTNRIVGHPLGWKGGAPSGSLGSAHLGLGQKSDRNSEKVGGRSPRPVGKVFWPPGAAQTPKIDGTEPQMSWQGLKNTLSRRSQRTYESTAAKPLHCFGGASHLCFKADEKKEGRDFMGSKFWINVCSCFG